MRGGGTLYLGTGTLAGWLAADPETGSFHSILPERYQSYSYVYEQAYYNSKAYAVISSPCKEILEYDPERGTVSQTGLVFTEGGTLSDTGLKAEECDGALNLLGDLLLFKDGAIAGQISPGTQVSCLGEGGIVHGLTGSGVYQQLSPAGEVLFQRDLGDLLGKTYSAPVEFLAYNDILYVPWRRFVVRKGGEDTVFLVTDEPQASTVTADGIYTANYTECTVYFYPFETFDEDPDAVWMNDPDRFLLADIENQCRPTQMEVSPEGNYLVVGSGPRYGYFGGAVSVYDLKEQRLLYTHENVVEGHQIQSVKCSAARPGCVWLGTSPYGENTNPPYLDEPSHLILWDIAEERILLDLIPDGEMKKIAFIAELDGRVYCVTQDGRIHSYRVEDGEAQAVNTRIAVSNLLADKNGRLIAANETTLYSLDPETLRAEILADGFTALNHLAEDPATGKLYAFEDADLLEFEDASPTPEISSAN